jgi:hypothetical protein
MIAGATERSILDVLDAAASAYEFPMLDNGYVYPVDVRLSAYGDGGRRWAMAFEWMGTSERSGDFSNAVYCFGNALTSLKSEKDYVTPEAYALWRAENPHWEEMFLFPMLDGPSGAPE